MATGNIFGKVELSHQKLQDDGVLFPAVLSPNYSTDHSTALQLRDFKEAIKAHKQWLELLLQKSGAILFRGFPVASASDFNDIVETFSYPEAFNIGVLPSRTRLVGRVCTANESPPEKGIPFHHEMAYVSDCPTKLFFYCDEEPGKGGETPIVLSHIIYEKMKEKHPEFVAQLEEHGLTYTKISNEEDDPSSFTGSGWKSTYKTNDKDVAEERAAEQGVKLEWIGNAVKIISGPLPAVRLNKENCRKTWFNSLAVTYNGPASEKFCNGDTSVVLGNGDPVPDFAMEDYLKILEEECVAIPWKKGDVLWVNNMMVLHSRRPLVKLPRRILTCVCK